MDKDATIERAFRGYFAGMNMPKVDLDAAKAELVSSRRRAAARRTLFACLSSSLACILVAVVLLFALLPTPVRAYEIASASAETVAYSDLQERYGEEAKRFAPFSLSENATAEYTLYSVEGETVLLEARLGYMSSHTRATAIVRVDLSKGKYAAEELSSYQELPTEYASYRGQVQYLNGEYVGRAYAPRETGDIYADVTSKNSGALSFIMSVLLG